LQNKVIIIAFLILLISGCSVSRYKKQNKEGASLKSVTENSNEVLINKNITKESFYIKKIEIVLESGNENEKFLGSLKFVKPDSFLLNIRTKTGLEAARVFFTKDTVLINDRFNKILYFGTKGDLKIKYGFNLDLFPIILGDFMSDNSYSLNEINCKENRNITIYFKGERVKYSIDCKTAKAKEISILKEIESNSLNLKFEKFVKSNEISFGLKEEIYGLGKIGSLNIIYSKIERPWYGKIEFIPGRNYELVRIK
jgi:hypothetical protein